MVGRLAESYPRIDADPAGVEAGMFQQGSLTGEILPDLGNHVAVLRIVLHGAR